MGHLGESVLNAVAAVVLVGVGLRLLLLPRRARASELLGLHPERLWWPWSVFARRFRSPGYLKELRIVGAMAVLMGLFFGFLAILIATGRIAP